MIDIISAKTIKVCISITVITTILFFPQRFLVELFKHKNKEFYSEYPYTHHLESILYSIFYCTFFIAYLFIYPSYFPDAFQCRLQTSVLLFQLSPLQIMVGSSLLSLSAFFLSSLVYPLYGLIS